MESDPKTTTVADLFHVRLAAIDETWRKVLAVHADLSHSNEASKENRSAMNDLSDAFAAMWRFKAAWAQHE